MIDSRDQITEKLFSDIVQTLPVIIETAIGIMEEPTRRGGYLCVSESFGLPVLILSIGKIEDGGKAIKYLHLCQEKATSLSQNPEHVSSRQSRDESKQQYRGAIRVKCKDREFIFSFSGLPEKWDEISMLALARQVHVEICGRSMDYPDKDPHLAKLLMMVPLS